MARKNKVFDHKKVEVGWQKKWKETELYKASKVKKNNYYQLVELAYSSGDLHIGHWFGWTAPDVLARFKRMQGYNVLFPVGGFDSFGLPAENAAIKHGVHPRDWTNRNVAQMRKQFATMGPSFDWEAEVITSDADYYRWTQWLFLQLFKAGLAYRDKVLSNWCPKCKTVLANEHVQNGCCWRHTDTEVVQKKVDQWLVRITDYADRLVWSENPKVDWPLSMRKGQNDWVGRSEGIKIQFSIYNSQLSIEVFTTRPDTLYGATFMILAPEHPLALKITTDKQLQKVKKYIKSAEKKLERDRLENAKNKTGVFTGAYALNPLSNEKIPIWIADFVLMDYGTGAIMGVPAHDDRDWAFAKKHKLAIKPVIRPEFSQSQIDKGIEFLLKEIIKDSEEANKKIVIGGGWILDAEFRRRIRNHSDVDMYVPIKDMPFWKNYFSDKGFKYEKLDKKKNDRFYLSFSGSDKKRKYYWWVDIVGYGADDKGQLYDKEEGKREYWGMAEKNGIKKGKLFGSSVYYLAPAYKIKSIIECRNANLPKDPNKDYRKYDIDMELLGQQSSKEYGILFNSGNYSGLTSSEAIKKITSDLVKLGIGKKDVQYHIRDWTISRRRYWGAPIPIIYCNECGTVPVPEADLPVELPYKVDYRPTGKAPLATSKSFVNTKCPECGGKAKRETETMDTYVDSSWYFFRYPDPNNSKAIFDKKTIKEWMPIQVYFGGPEHILGHTLYARFITKFLHDQGYIDFDEFAQKRWNHGIILGTDGFRMSKSRGNVVNPDQEVKKYGADAVRLYLCFMGPHEFGAPWKREGIEGASRFLQRVWRLVTENTDLAMVDEADAEEILRTQHKTVQKVTKDIESFHFNTAVSAIMEYVNELRSKVPNNKSQIVNKPQVSNVKVQKTDNQTWDEALKTLVQLLAPFAPHMAEEVWVNVLGQKFSIHKSKWPKYLEEFIKEDMVTIAVQINGKLRSTLDVNINDSTYVQKVLELARKDENINKWISAKKVKKEIFVPGKLLNFVV